MKKLLISSLAVLALATASLTLADTYNSNGTTDVTKGSVKKAETMSTEKLKIQITGTRANGEKIKPTEVTVNQQTVEGKTFTLDSNSAVVKVAGERCDKTNADTFFNGKPRAVKLLKLKVENGDCKMATFE